MALDKSKIDVAALFLGYMALVGDVEKTAIAFDMAPADVAELAEAEGWADKIRRVSVMSKSEKPGDWERAQNRALCFVQAYQIRQLISRWTTHLLGMDVETMLAKTATTDRQGSPHYSARLISDLVTAAEACHRMSYNALGDTVTERMDKKGPDGQPGKLQDTHSAIIAALNHRAELPATKELLTGEAIAVTKSHTERSQSEGNAATSDEGMRENHA